MTNLGFLLLLVVGCASGYRLAAVQSAPQGNYAHTAAANNAADVAHLRLLLQQADGAALVVLPEVLLWGYALTAPNASAARARLRDYALAMPPTGTAACDEEGRGLLALLACLARDAGTTLVADVVTSVQCHGMGLRRTWWMAEIKTCSAPPLP